jgi:hypothetical protein
MAENTNLLTRFTNAGLIIQLWLKWRMTSGTAACLLGERRAPAFRSGMFRLTEFRTGHPLVRNVAVSSTVTAAWVRRSASLKNLVARRKRKGVVHET